MFNQSETRMFGEYPYYDYCWEATCDYCGKLSSFWGKTLEDIRSKSEINGWSFKRQKVSEPSKLVCEECK